MIGNNIPLNIKIEFNEEIPSHSIRESVAVASVIKDDDQSIFQLHN